MARHGEDVGRPVRWRNWERARRPRVRAGFHFVSSQTREPVVGLFQRDGPDGTPIVVPTDAVTEGVETAGEIHEDMQKSLDQYGTTDERRADRLRRFNERVATVVDGVEVEAFA